MQNKKNWDYFQEKVTLSLGFTEEIRRKMLSKLK